MLPESAPRAQRHRVLLVESDPGDAEMIQIWLRRARETRYEIWHVETLGDALGCLAKASFDLALVDLALPDESGPRAFHALRERHADLPVIVFTSFAEAEVGERLLDEGAQDHLVKGQMSGDTLIRSMRHGIEHGRLTEALHDARSEAQDAAGVRSEMVAELRHEFRTPLHTVLGMADLLLETELTREQEGYVRSFMRASETLLSRLDALLGAEPAVGEGGRAQAGPGPLAEGATRVLVADDSEDARERVVGLLRAADHVADGAPNGRIAVEMFREGDYDLVLMDAKMPELDGRDAVRAIRRIESDAGRTETPILAVTGGSPADASALMDAGCDAHLPKPVSEATLLAAVARHAPKHHGRLMRVAGESLQEIDLYLHERHNDLAALRLALEAGDLDAVRAVGHDLEASAVDRGFEELASLGGALQGAASTGDRTAVERSVADLGDFLREVKIVVG